MADKGAIVDMVDVSKRFAGVLALDRVSLTLQPGRVHALVGENGAGKSTLIKVLTGVHQADGGEIHYLGGRHQFGSPREAQAAGISTIYQEVNLIGLLSLARNLFLGREPTRWGLIDFRRMNREATEILAQYNIEVDVTRPLRELGLGVQQMVAIVRAISTDARVVIMDEPTSSLEPREVDRLADVIGVLRSRGAALLYVTHKLDEVFRICQDVTVLRDGRRVHTGEVAQTSRLRLVATMLGRDITEVREHGLTRFGDTHDHANTEPVLEARGLTRQHVLAGVSVAVHRGQVVGLAGLLGSGRTETAKAIFGADPVDGGELSVGQRRWRRWKPATTIGAGVGMVPEDRKAEGIVGQLSVRDNIALAILPRLTRIGLVSDRQRDEVVDALISRLRIKVSDPDQPASELSGGNQQKVLLARMLCLRPVALLLDEPTRGIDVGAKAEIQKLISELAGEGLGVLLISSELEEVVEGADVVLVLKDGAVVGTLNGDDISEDNIMSIIAAAPGAEDD